MRFPYLFTTTMIFCLFTYKFASAEVCVIRGTAPFCDGECQSGEVKRQRFGSNCLTGTKVRCCNPLAEDRTTPRGCRWRGTAPFCGGTCEGSEIEVTRSSVIVAGGVVFTDPDVQQGFGDSCVTGQKALCCHPDDAVSPRTEGLVSPRECKDGYVWREAFPGDYVCVTPEVREAAKRDNAEANNRKNQQGGAYGPDTCLQGYVWREANPNDHICVTPETRTQTRKDNSEASIRVRNSE